ncbi:MAG TPA: polymer-forming cytoskeletal protein, partial [Opitutaceae bacterium]|nr:polymer-forming cytoskeletal protein [Opitutaceae bacterium]
MKIRSLLLSLSVFCAIVVCFAPGLHSQDAKPAPAAPEPTDTVSADAGAPTSTSSSESDSKLRVLSGSTEEEKQKEPAPTSSKSSTRKKARIHGIHHSGQPYIATEFSIRKGETAGDVVAIRSKGVIDGDVDGDVVCILSRVTINGHVNGDVVDILGSVRLGPDAVIDGEKVAIIGAVTSVDQVGNAKGGFGGVEQLQMWLEHALMHGRILALHSSLRWVWVMMMGSIAFYAFLALILRKPMDTCAAAFETSPGYSILCGVLILLMFPLVLALSAITVVGPIVLIFALPLVSLFGRATMMAFLGSRLTRLTAENNPLRHPFFGVLIGSAIALLLYLLPVVGVIVWALIGVLGLGSVVYAIIVAIRRKPKA